MGVFIISPNDKGGKLYEPPPKLVELVRAALADAFSTTSIASRGPRCTRSVAARRGRAISTSTLRR
jgi:hypothetical protein